MEGTSAMDGMVKVMASGDLPRGEAGDTELRPARVGDNDILLARRGDGRVVAFAAQCPHQMTELSGATFWDGRVRCPRHNYIYDPLSGDNVLPKGDCRPENLWKLAPGYLPVYRVTEADGWVWVAESPEPPPAGYDPAREKAPGLEELMAAAQAAEAAPSGPVEHPVKRLRVGAGATFELRIPTTFRPGFVWRIEVPADLLAVVEERYESGDPPRHRVKLAARNVGTGAIRAVYTRPWETEPAEVRTYEVEVKAL
ncbi:MAG: Rieske 2Fe-2S domain-containing protein [Acidimicrobiales bacterium]